MLAVSVTITSAPGLLTPTTVERFLRSHALFQACLRSCKALLFIPGVGGSLDTTWEILGLGLDCVRMLGSGRWMQRL